MTAVVWKDKHEVHMLTNIHDPSIIFNVKNLHMFLDKNVRFGFHTHKE